MKPGSTDGHRPKKSLGQNFLCDTNVIGKIIDAVDPSETDIIFEIGPGLGALTEPLVASGGIVAAIEFDRELAARLRDRFAAAANFDLIFADALSTDFSRLATEAKAVNPNTAKVKLAANLPYYISTAILQHIVPQRSNFDRLVLMLQREVVERITARPGNSERGFLTVHVESAFTVEKLFDVPPEAFRPKPKVWSSVVTLTPKVRFGSEIEFRNLISTAFAQKRKTIFNNLKNAFANAAEVLENADIDKSKRAEELTLEQWLRLNDVIGPIR